jgi:hypothetical protein
MFGTKLNSETVILEKQGLASLRHRFSHPVRTGGGHAVHGPPHQMPNARTPTGRSSHGPPPPDTRPGSVPALSSNPALIYARHGTALGECQYAIENVTRGFHLHLEGSSASRAAWREHKLRQRRPPGVSWSCGGPELGRTRLHSSTKIV